MYASRVYTPYTVKDRIYGNFSAKMLTYTLYMNASKYVWYWPNLVTRQASTPFVSTAVAPVQVRAERNWACSLHSCMHMRVHKWPAPGVRTVSMPAAWLGLDCKGLHFGLAAQPKLSSQFTSTRINIMSSYSQRIYLQQLIPASTFLHLHGAVLKRPCLSG
jgi:hypothetical protein